MNFVKKILCGFVIIFSLLLSPQIILCAEAEEDNYIDNKVIYTNAASFSVITLWGIFNWDYFQKSMNAKNEGWFSEDTKYGGADKAGHFYISYSASHLYSHLYKGWGISPEKSALLGASSSFLMMGWMEVGDSFSDYGFSHEDFVMNTIGCVTAYFLDVYPWLSEKIDFRAEYMPKFEKSDFFTDYENTKYLMALKLNGFDSFRDNFAEYFEFHLGYYTRNYSEDHKERERNIYIGFGINLSNIFYNFSMEKTSKVFNYLQVPYTYISYDNDLNE